MNQINLIKKIWKTGLISLVVSIMIFGGLFLNVRASKAAGNPHFEIIYVGNNANDPSDTWDNDVHLEVGQKVTLYTEIHNTVIGTTAQNVKIKSTLPSSTGDSTSTVWADGVNSASKNVKLTFPADTELKYVAGSTKMTWDKDGDGNFEFKDTVLADGITAAGLQLGNQNGCNEYIIQVAFKAELVKVQPSPSPTPSPTPTPTPTPVVSPSPTASPTIVINNHQEQKQEQHNNQTVNITNTGAVAGAKVPAKTPETGVSVLGLGSILGAGPVGFALSRFGKGRTVGKKDDEETLSEMANNLLLKKIKHS